MPSHALSFHWWCAAPTSAMLKAPNVAQVNEQAAFTVDLQFPSSSDSSVVSYGDWDPTGEGRGGGGVNSYCDVTAIWWSTGNCQMMIIT